MKLWIPFAVSAGTLLAIASFVGAGWDAPPVESTQLGYRGTGMVIHRDIETQEALKAANVVPDPPWVPDPSGEKAKNIYQNVQVLGELSDDQFNQVMAAITSWIAPAEQGCNYCHNPENMASDEIYTKVVARRMIQMTQAINVDWKPHVGATGVTCYTCHRGNAVPAQVWSASLEPKPAGNMTQDRGRPECRLRAGRQHLAAAECARCLSARRRADPRARHHGPAERHVDGGHQGDGKDLVADDPHVGIARRQLRHLPQFPRLQRLGPEPAAARHRLARHPHGA